MDSLIILKTENFKVKVSRRLMVEKSKYFSAALTSGMLEATSGQFHFSNMSADQLSLLADCARLNFSAWPSSGVAEHDFRTQPNPSAAPKWCRLKESTHKMSLERNKSLNYLLGAELSSHLKSAVELASVADYLQINCLTELCLIQLTDLTDKLWIHFKAYTNDSVHARGSDDDNPSSAINIAQSLLIHCLDLSQLYDKRCFNLLLEHIFQHPGEVFSTPHDDHDTLVSTRLAHLVAFILSSNRLCLSDEDSVLEIMLYWVIGLINSPIDFSDSFNPWEAFIDSVRPGLLSPEARQRFFNFWSAHFPSIQSFGTFTVDSMAQLFKNSLIGGTFASIQVDMTTACMKLYRPRASVPCLLSLLPTASGDNFEIWIFNLLSFSHRKFMSSPEFFTLLTGCNPNTGDFTRRMFLCHSNIASTVIILCYDIVNNRLSGFLWSLTNFEAEWLPSLALPVIRTYNTAATSTSLSGNPLGVASLSTGLYVYCATISGGYVQLHTFRLDVEANSWQEFTSTSLATVPTNGLVIFTPVEQISCLATTNRLYANLEITYRSTGAEARIRRHNLHHTSQLRSLFLCFTPVFEERRLSVQMLPPAPFLVRIHRLLTVRSPETTNEFIFAFGTCTRDQSASQVCFDVTSCRWVQWSPARSSQSSTSQLDVTNPRRLVASLDPELLGFRGLVCVTHLPLTQGFETSDDDAELSYFRVFDEPADQLVLIGRPDYRFDDEQREITPGVWFHQPHIFFPGPDQACDSGSDSKPQLAFPLPASLLQRLYDLPSPALVVLVNWDQVVRLEEGREPFVFRNKATPMFSDNAKKSADGSALISSSPVTASLLSCMNYALGYSACDSD